MTTRGGRHPGRLSSGAKVVLTTTEAHRGIARARPKKRKSSKRKKR